MELLVILLFIVFIILTIIISSVLSKKRTERDITIAGKRGSAEASYRQDEQQEFLCVQPVF